MNFSDCTPKYTSNAINRLLNLISKVINIPIDKTIISNMVLKKSKKAKFELKKHNMTGYLITFNYFKTNNYIFSFLIVNLN